MAPTPRMTIGKVRPSTKLSKKSGKCLSEKMPPPPMTKALNLLTFLVKNGWLGDSADGCGGV